MILLDTNVVSELMRSEPDSRVLAWADSQSDDVGVASMTIGELVSGVARLPSGPRRDRLAERVERTILEFFTGSILPFDDEAALVFGALTGRRVRSGTTMPLADAVIAATAAAHGAILATRNVGDFDGCGLALVDPWAVKPGQRA